MLNIAVEARIEGFLEPAGKQNRIKSSLSVPLTSALLNLPKGKSLGRSKPATNS
jgi:hypothetical protein